mgnify:CR=1 FL=1|jgi:hypothetical protein
MRKFTLLAAVLLSCGVSFAQTVEFVRNGEVLADGATIKVSEMDGPEMSPEVLVRNSSGEEVVTVLKITTVKNGEVGFCGYCGFGTELCVTVGEGQSVARGVILPAGETIDPAIHWQGIRGENPIVDAIVKYELKTGGVLEPNKMGTMDIVDEGNTISTITVNLNNDPTSINSLEANANVYFSGNEFSYHFNDVANRQLNIYNVTGSLVKSVSLETEGTVAINNLNKGVYIYEVKENGKRIAAHKCVIR